MSRTEELRTKKFEEAEWQKLFYKHQQQYIRKRLEAIKYLHEGKTRREVMEKVGCARQSLITWIDMYCQGGLKALTTPVTSEREQRLGLKEKEELKRIILEKKPTDYGIDRQIWTGKIIIEVINQKWNVQIKDSRIYDILKEIGLSHQKGHRDYENSDRKAQEAFVSTIKKKCKNWSLERG
jgi:transposase